MQSSSLLLIAMFVQVFDYDAWHIFYLAYSYSIRRTSTLFVFGFFTFGLLGLAIFIYFRHILTTVCFLSSKKSSTFSIIFSFILFHIGMDILPYFYYSEFFRVVVTLPKFPFLKCYEAFASVFVSFSI